MNVGDIYQRHHAEKGRLGFSVLETERAAWFASHVKKGGAFLDLGCRDATLTAHLAPMFDSTVGVDVDPAALAEARKKIPTATFAEMDLLGDWSLLQGRTFDAILCSEVLEHVYFPDSVAEKIAAHLAPGGTFVGSVPNAFFLKHRMRYLLGRRQATPLDDPTHITQFNIGRLRQMLRPFKTVRIEGYTRPPFDGLARTTPGLFAFDFLFAASN